MTAHTRGVFDALDSALASLDLATGTGSGIEYALAREMVGVMRGLSKALRRLFAVLP